MGNDIESNKYTGCGAGGAGGKQMLFDRDNLQKILQDMKFREDPYAGNPNAGGSGSNGILYEIREELKECPMK